MTVGTDVSAKYRGAFCEAKIKSAKRLVKAKVSPSFEIRKPRIPKFDVSVVHVKTSAAGLRVVELRASRFNVPAACSAAAMFTESSQKDSKLVLIIEMTSRPSLPPGLGVRTVHTGEQHQGPHHPPSFYALLMKAALGLQCRVSQWDRSIWVIQ